MGDLDRAHSIYSPSGFTRWEVCSGSAQKTKDMESPDSPDSLRGTWLHERSYERVAGKEFSHNPEDICNIQSNWEALHSATDVVLDHIEAASLISPATVLLEKRVDLDVLGHEDVYGTCDVQIYAHSEDTLYIIDYKFGNGLVEPKDNGQLYIYALGAALSCDVVPQFIEVAIVQPANQNKIYNSYGITFSELMQWWETVGEPAIQAAKAENPPLVPGDDQCRWCPASGDCEAQTDASLAVLDMYQPDKQMTKSYDIAEILPQLPMVEQFIKGVRKQAIEQLKNGGTINGYKLVRGNTHRKWIDEEKADRWLAARKIGKDDRTVKKLISIPVAEKILGEILKDNPRLAGNFKKLITQPEGKLTLAPASDKRPEVNFSNPLLDDSIEEDFMI